ncbi:MAG: hypothetical protein J6C98_03800, partial [Oscillospiraceae bacterium]|nr:hypothetical protein [Oscillospiraceae bacterium]
LHAQFLARHLDENDLQCAVIAVLVDLGFATNRDGFAYLVQAVMLFVGDPSLRATKDIYSLISGCAGAGDDGLIENAIRCVIYEAWENRDESVWRIYFRSNQNGAVKKPTNTSFISQVGYFMILWQACCRKEARIGK